VPATFLTGRALAFALLFLCAGGCARTLNQVRAEPAALQLPPVAEPFQEAIAHCIQDRIYEDMGFMYSIVQETRREPDGWHVIGRASSFPTGATWDVAITSVSLEVRFASAPLLPRGVVLEAVKWCATTRRAGLRAVADGPR
jgi:hypothetical protein